MAQFRAFNRLTSSLRRHKRLAYIAVAFLVFAADQFTKSLVERYIPLHSTITVIPHFFNLTDTRNPGAAFGLFSQSASPWRSALLIGISAALLAVVIGVVWKSLGLRWLAGVALALIIGGAASNLTDRIRYGEVTDFLDFHIRSLHWFTFNLADSAIVVGALLLIFHLTAGK